MKPYILALSACLVLSSCGGQAPAEVITTENRSVASQKEFFLITYPIIYRAGQGIVLVEAKRGQKLELKTGVSLDHSDHHITRTLTLSQIDDSGAYFDYQYRFDHRSFGKDRVDYDHGNFFIAWNEPAAGI